MEIAFIKASEIQKKYIDKSRSHTKRCFLEINKQRIELVSEKSPGIATGFIWYFICPVTFVRCRNLHLINGLYVHRSLMPNFYRRIKPMYYSGSKMDELFKIKESAIKAEQELGRKHLKKTYSGKPTKKYLKCLQQIDKAKGISMTGIVNGQYDSLLKMKK